MSPLFRALEEFRSLLGVSYTPSKSFLDEALPFVSFSSLRVDEAQLVRDRQNQLLSAVNSKFRFNWPKVKALFDSAAAQGFTFNYHEKNAIALAFDELDQDGLSRILDRRELGLANRLGVNVYSQALTHEQTIARLHKELKTPTLTRKDSKPRDWSQDILESLFASYLTAIFGLNSLHQFNVPAGQYEPDFWRFLLARNPHLHSDGPSLIYLDIASNSDSSLVREKIARSYNLLPSFGHLAIWIHRSQDVDVWSLFADVVLFAERHIERDSHYGFFKPDKVKAETVSHNLGISVDDARFDTWHDGFYYQDCFVVGDGEPSLLVLMQKREADEEKIPCPTCRSENVRGNSYASLGIKSWECKSLICPDRSKFGRGRRYSFVQLLKQAAIEDEANEIPKKSIRSWMRDVQTEKTESLTFEMLVRHYTLVGDRVLLDQDSSIQIVSGEFIGRRLEHAQWEEFKKPFNFDQSAFFSRYDIARVDKSDRDLTKDVKIAENGSLVAVCAESCGFLRSIGSESIDGAVTSPPYYNAKEYSQWANIYTYLYDMRAIAAEVFRLLKPGAYYLYNIFDYFDNENIVVMSAMGDRRIPLGAYTIDLFRRVGFVCEGNIVWDKGDIEGKRGFNGGNPSPFYQAPFNCWEHVLVFRKPPIGSEERLEFPRVFRQGAVIKMIRGENKHGHSAPYPPAIPALLAKKLPQGSVILDPFAGSMTTAIAASEAGIKAICIEQNEAYFELGLERYRSYEGQRTLF